MPTNPAEIREKLKSERLKQRAQLQKAQIDAAVALAEANANARAKIEGAREEVADERSERAGQEGGGGVSGAEIPFSNVNPRQPTSNVSQRAFEGLEETTQGERPREAARGGSAAQELLARSGRSPVAGGRLQEAQSRSARPTAPPLLTSQQTTTTEGTRQVGPGGLVVPTRERRTTTRARPNVLSAGDALRARIRQRESARDRLQETVEAEAKALGGLLFQAETGGPEDKRAVQSKVEEIRAQYGPQAALRIQQRARQERTRLDVKERQSVLQSERVEERGKRRESRRRGQPSQQAQSEEARIQMKILRQGRGALTEKEESFLQERNRADFIDRIMADVLSGSGPTPRQPTQEEVTRHEDQFREKKGRDPNPAELRAFMENRGFTFQ